MFNNKRYITVGINKEIPVYLQIFIWNLIDSLDNIEKDYLQVFELYEEDKYQVVVHSQEKLEYKQKCVICNMNQKPIASKIFVIDSGDYSTMLLSNEY